MIFFYFLCFDKTKLLVLSKSIIIHLKMVKIRNYGQRRSPRGFERALCIWPKNALIVGIFQKFKNQPFQKRFYFVKLKKNRNVKKTDKITTKAPVPPLIWLKSLFPQHWWSLELYLFSLFYCHLIIKKSVTIVPGLCMAP